VATEGFRDQLLHRFPFLDPARVVTVTNGYDPDDFPADLMASARPPEDRFVITYAGTIFKQNSPRGLLGALRLLREREPELSRLLTLRFIGRIVDTELDAFEGSEEFGVERVGFVEKARVMPALAGSHMALCLLDIMPGAERIYPAKIFESMLLDRPCLTLAPPGALADLALRHQLGPVVPPRDEAAIADALAKALSGWRAGTFNPRSTAVGVARYHRREIAAQFADVFRRAAAQIN
jgi:glycosyltransferase involved in cell wall biosynthesis